MRAQALSPEFKLVAACCIWPSQRRDSAVRVAMAMPMDWASVLRIVKRQRVAGFVRDGLQCVWTKIPAPIAENLEAMAKAIPWQNLQAAAESTAIQRALDHAGIACLFVKGVTLAQIAYGGLGAKHSWDIDLLVLPPDVPRALVILQGMGYRPAQGTPSPTHPHFARWLRFARECVLVGEAGATPLELHWRLTNSGHFLRGVSASSPAQNVKIGGGIELRTLTDDDLFAYLCLHGASHAWERLKWLADVAALITNDSEADAHRRLDAARMHNAHHSVAQAFLLCDRLFGTPGAAAMAGELRRHRRYHWLECLALRAMLRVSELGQAQLDSLPAHTSHFLLGSGLAYPAIEFWDKLNGPFDLQNFTPPPGLGFLYPLARLGFWLRRGGRSQIR